MSPQQNLLQAAGPPCWDSGLPFPTLSDEADPVQEAHAAVTKVTEAVCGHRGGLPRNGGAAVAVVDEVFTLVQLALDSRRVFTGATEEREAGVSPRESAFRAALLPVGSSSRTVVVVVGMHAGSGSPKIFSCPMESELFVDPRLCCLFTSLLSLRVN